MITIKSWQILLKKQAELDQLIVEKSPVDLKWISRSNAERLKLALLVEVGEFANEIKSFKAWRKKQEINLVKAKEEFVDCLGYFLGLCNIFQIEKLDYYFYPAQQEDLTERRKDFKLTQEKIALDIKENPKLQKLEVATGKNFAKEFAKSLEAEISSWEKLYQWIYDKEVPFNKLLLEFFYKTNDLFIIEVDEINDENLYSSAKVKGIPNSSYYHWLSVFNKLCEKLQISEQELLTVYLTKNKINQQRAKEK